MTIRLLTRIALLFILVPYGRTQEAPRPRVALMHFISEDNSHRSAVAARDFTAAIQAMLSADDRHEWVERAELDVIEQELGLAGFGLIDRSESLRHGRLARADWGIFGRISPPTPDGPRTVTAEIVDLHRADVLAVSSASLPGQDDNSFVANESARTTVATQLWKLLVAAGDNAKSRKEQIQVGLVFLTSDSGYAPENSTAPPQPVQLKEALPSALMKTSEMIHVLSFTRADAGADEASLILGGMADSNDGSLLDVADVYVWGHCSTRPVFLRNAKPGGRGIGPVSKVVLKIWNGRSQSRSLELTVEDTIDPNVIANEVVNDLLPILLAAERTNAPAADVRAKVSDEVLRTATGFRDPARTYFPLGTPEGRADWFDLIAMMEIACFFNPASRIASE